MAFSFFVLLLKHSPQDGIQKNVKLKTPHIMGFGSCDCEEDPLVTVVDDGCGEDLGQVQKIIVQRRQSDAPFASLADAIVLENWQELLDADDDTKCVITPFFDSFVIPPSDAVLIGGDSNETVDGAPRLAGATTPRATGQFASILPSVLEQLQNLNCEGDRRLSVYLVNEHDDIFGLSKDGVTFQGIPVTSFFVGDPGNDGKNTNDKTNFSFSLRHKWANKRKKVSPTAFSALNDLAPTES